MKSNVLDSFSMEGKTVIITGGAGFLGMQYARALGEAGADIVLWDLKDESVLKDAREKIEEETGRTCFVQRVDITNEEAVTHSIEEVLKKFKVVDVLINNAAMNAAVGTDEAKNLFSPYDKYPMDLWRKEFEVNVHGAMICTKAIAPHMMKQKSGSIVNIASGVALNAYDNRTYSRAGWENKFKSIAYSTSKSAILGLTRQWAEYLGKYGVRVNTFTPSGVQTPKHTPEFVKSYSDGNMLGRMAQVEDYGPVMVFLCSDASSFMTGSNLIVDGGKSAW